MAVTKRVRFEVLRRDNHTCQYCGAKAPDVELQIDHVMPKALGGDDKPGNLIAACRPCNSGKTSITPDSPLVEGLSDRAAAYALGMQDKMVRFRAEVESLQEYTDEFVENWNTWTVVGKNENLPLPDDHELSLFAWLRQGVPMKVLTMATAKAMNKPGIRGEHGVFQYVAGVVNGMLRDREIDLSVTKETAAFCTQSEADEMRVDGYQHGYSAGMQAAEVNAMLDDALRNHIDGSRPEMVDGWQGSKMRSGKLVWGGTRAREYSQ